MYVTYTNEKLLQLIKHNDEGAFSALYNRCWKQLLVQATSLLNSQEEAEEIVQDVFVQLWKKRDSINIVHTVNTYISAMTRYGCLKILAKRKQAKRLENLAIPFVEQENSTELWLDFEDLRQQLEEAISQLPDKCQLIFKYSREAGLNDKEIASKLDLSVNTVRTQMHRALKKLKTSLNSFFH
ncbi:MAG: RNA polymerase sigma-70 factor [Chitinophagaceae bacterium]